MPDKKRTQVFIEDVLIPGHRKMLTIRSYRPSSRGFRLPIVLYFHGGGFVAGSLVDGQVAAKVLAEAIPAWVISIDYSLSPEFPFPAPLEDGYRALRWAVCNARENGAEADLLAVVGHDSGGNIATCLAAMIRDRGDFRLSAQALLAPLLDPSMTRCSRLVSGDGSEFEFLQYARRYRSYLPNVLERLHPYAAPIESRRLSGLAPAIIASVANDIFSVEAEEYAAALIAAGVPTVVKRHIDTTHQMLATHPTALKDIASFLSEVFNRPDSA